MAADELDPDASPREAPLGGFLTARRTAGLLGAAVVATVGYGLVTQISTLNAGVFFVIFLVVFAALNYAVWRYD